MKNCGILLFLWVSLFSFGCQLPIKTPEPPREKSLFFLPAQVLNVEKSHITLRVEKPALFQGEPTLALQLAQGIVDNSYFLEGKEIQVNDTKVKVERVMGDNVLLQILEKSPPVAPGDKVKIYLEKKTIAIRDFEVIIGTQKEAALHLQEDMTTALVNSGQFNVVERQKLQSLLEELKLSQLGLIDSSSAKQVGKMLGADLLLTGTFAMAGEECTGNIRIINAETGLITAAFNKKGPLRFKPEVMADAKNIRGDFEDE